MKRISGLLLAGLFGPKTMDDWRNWPGIHDKQEPPLNPRPIIEAMIETWKRLSTETERPPRPLRYVSVAEYAVHCVCAFLQWGNE